MRRFSIVLLALGAFGVAVTASAETGEKVRGPLVLEPREMDQVTAGIALLLPAVQQARESVRTTRFIVLRAVAEATRGGSVFTHPFDFTLDPGPIAGGNWRPGDPRLLWRIADANSFDLSRSSNP